VSAEETTAEVLALADASAEQSNALVVAEVATQSESDSSSSSSSSIVVTKPKQDGQQLHRLRAQHRHLVRRLRAMQERLASESEYLMSLKPEQRAQWFGDKFDGGLDVKLKQVAAANPMPPAVLQSTVVSSLSLFLSLILLFSCPFLSCFLFASLSVGFTFFPIIPTLALNLFIYRYIRTCR
jgi:hypothetical protein